MSIGESQLGKYLKSERVALQETSKLKRDQLEGSPY